jgi:signal transduction histidine kinase
MKNAINPLDTENSSERPRPYITNKMRPADIQRKDVTNLIHQKDDLEEERREFIRLYKKLRKDTHELRSSLTSLVLHTEEMESYSDRHKRCIIDICEVINKKNDELLYSEQLMREVILQFDPDADI